MNALTTFIQYRDSYVAKCVAEYGCTKAEAMECTSHLPAEWRKLVENAAEQGQEIPRTVLDSFCRTFTENDFLHTFRGTRELVDRTYILPSKRQQEPMRLSTRKAA